MIDLLIFSMTTFLGSDVGALVGALSGIVTSLFGVNNLNFITQWTFLIIINYAIWQPGGLDVPSLISTGTSLLAGLLGGDENFGKVLGNYLGLAVEGWIFYSFLILQIIILWKYEYV